MTDTERINWLLSRRHVEWFSEPPCLCVRIDKGLYVEYTGDLRVAIDAAIEETK